MDRAALQTRARTAAELTSGLVPVARAGIIAPMRPSRLARVVHSYLRWDFTPSGLMAVAAAREPDRTAVVDDAPQRHRQGRRPPPAVQLVSRDSR